jgi:RNA polymerase sigma factor (sigma-70 family)
MVNSVDDLVLTQKVQTEHCEDSLIELINRHKPLCLNIYRRFSPTLNASGVAFQDVVDDMPSIVYQSAKTFNPEKNVKFVTWLGNNIKFQCLNSLNLKKRGVLMDNEAITSLTDKNYNQLFQGSINPSTTDYIFQILDHLKDERIKKCFEIRYFKGCQPIPWRKVAKELGVSTQTAINLHTRGTKILREKLTSRDTFDFV